MKTQSIDTSPEAERVLVGMIRQAPITKRFAFLQSWTTSMLKGQHAITRKAHSRASDQEIRLLFMESQYGKDLVNEVRQAINSCGIQIADNAYYHQAIYSLATIFEQLDIPYALSGSLASSIYGMQRSTLQIDMIAAPRTRPDEPLCEQLTSHCYFRTNEVKLAIEQGTFFTAIHLKSLLKMVITLPQKLPQGPEVFHQVRGVPLVEGERPVAVLAPEQLISLLLDGFQRSNQRADDLWYDLLGVMKVQSTDLNLPFLMQQATVLGVVKLAEQALDDAGLTKGNLPNGNELRPRFANALSCC